MNDQNQRIMQEALRGAKIGGVVLAAISLLTKASIIKVPHYVLDYIPWGSDDKILIPIVIKYAMGGAIFGGLIGAFKCHKKIRKINDDFLDLEGAKNSAQGIFPLTPKASQRWGNGCAFIGVILGLTILPGYFTTTIPGVWSPSLFHWFTWSPPAVATNWFAVLIGIAILAVIGYLVGRSFGKK